MDAQQEEFFRTLSGRRLLILPIAVLGRSPQSDTTGASALADSLRANGIPGAFTTSNPIPIPFEPGANEAAILWSRFKALSQHVTSHPRTDADYVLLVDVFGRPDQSNVGAVHVMAVTGKGEMVYHGAWNSYQPLYKEFKPRSLNDATRMVATDIVRRRQT